MVFNDSLVHISIKDEFEERMLDREQIMLETRKEQESGSGPKKTNDGLTLYETRKINEQNLNEMKARMFDHVKQKTQEFRNLKSEVRLEVMKETMAMTDFKKEEVVRQRDIKKIIKTEQKAELDRNI